MRAGRADPRAKPPTAAAWRIILVESDADAAAAIGRHLREYHPSEVRRIASAASLDAALREPWDCLLTAHAAGDLTSFDVLEIVARHGAKVPVIVVGGPVGEDVAVAAVRDGAADFVPRDRLAFLGPAVARAIAQANEAARRRELEERLAGFFRLSPDPVAIATRDGRILDANEAWERRLGVRPEALAGRPLADLLLDEDEPRLAAALATAIERGEPERFDARAVAADGTVRWFRWSLAATRDGSQIHAVAHDVTTQLAAREALRASEERLRRVLEAITEGIVMLDRSGVLVYANRAAEDLLGFGRGELLGESVASIPWRAYDRPVREFDEAMREAAAGAGGNREIEVVVTRRDGAEAVLSANWVPLRDAAGNLVGLVASLTDITRRKRHEEEIERLTASLEQRVAARTRELADANRELDAFSAAASHDLRAPLRRIEQLAVALEEDLGDAIPSEDLQLLGRIQGEVERMRSLVEDLLSLSRAKGAPLEPQRIDLTAMARDILVDFAAASPSRRGDFDVEEGLVAWGDPRLLRVVLVNLLGNAWKFTRDREVARIRFHRLPDGAFAVSDNGPGFDPAEAGKLFRPFGRLHGATFEGTGIGLVTVARIVARHGGEVRAEGRPGKGATFAFTLPEPQGEAVSGTPGGQG